MNKVNPSHLNDLFKVLSQFIEGKSNLINNKVRRNPIVVHYYNEIVRYWNRLNFIFKRLISSPKETEKLSSFHIAKSLYVIFRYYEENASLEELANEVDKNIFNTSFIKRLEIFSLDKALKKKSELEQFSLRYAYPTFMIKHLEPYMNIDFLKENLTQMNIYNLKNKKVTFYLNKLKIRDQNELIKILRDLENNTINVLPDNKFPELYHTPLKNKKKLVSSEPYKTGKIIVVDKASVFVVNALGAQKSELIGDLCAAPGIKVSLLSQITNNESKIIANDFSYRRVKSMREIFKNLSISSTLILNSDSIMPPLRLSNRFDRILIDAPCSGTGTLFNNPELKWRQNYNFLKQNMILQTKLLNSGINCLKLGGILVYSTCSLYAEEGELQILKFLDKLEPQDLPEWISPSYKINGRYIEGTGRLFPSTHFTKGFFIGRFKKKKDF